MLTREVFFNTKRELSNLQTTMQFSFYYIKFLIHNDVFGDFPKISDNFPKIFEDFPKCVRRPDERFRTFTKHFRRCPKISEDNRKLSRTSVEDPKMFRSLSNKFRYNLISMKLSISSLVRIRKIRHPSPGCSFVCILRVVYFPVKHSCLYNKMAYVP